MTLSPRRRPALLPLCATLLLTLTGCGRPEYCAQTYNTWRAEAWAPYCQGLKERIQTPMDYDLVDLTTYFANYPKQQETLSKKLASYEDPQQCSATAQEELAYTEQLECIRDQDAQHTNMTRAWGVRADAWLKEIGVQVQGLELKLRRAEKIAALREKEAIEALGSSEPLEPEGREELAKVFDPLQKETMDIGQAKMQHETFMRASLENEKLADFIRTSYGTKVAKVLDGHEKNRVTVAKMANKLQFIEIAAAASGTPCTLGRGDGGATRDARGALAEKIDSLNVGKRGVSAQKAEKVKAEDGAQTETITGKLCGLRGPNKQFEGRPEVCAYYTFSLQREKPADSRKFGAWSVASLTEGDVTQGVDCSLLK